MLTKIQKYLSCNHWYKIAVVIISLNFLFEIVFQYHFESKIEVLYFFIAVIICAVMIINMKRTNNEKHLFIHYYFWPAILLFISCISLYKFSLLPFVISSFIILFLGKFKKKLVKRVVIIVNFIVFLVYLLIGWFLFYSPYTFNATKEIVETVYSSDNKYVMNLEEGSVGATGGDVKLYVGRNIDFGILGRYMPTKIKYWGP